MMSERYWKVHRKITPEPGAVPIDFFGLPNGASRSALFVIDELPEKARTWLYLEMTDVDAPREAMIFVNDTGPLPAPDGIVSGSMRKSAVLEVPAGHFRSGRNEVRFVFDNLNGGTSGFLVDVAAILVDAPR